MASEFYYDDEGNIHRYPVTAVNNTGNHTNTCTPAAAAAHVQARTEYRPTHQVSEGKIIWFWIISISIAILIAVVVTQGLGAEIYGSKGSFFATIGPFVVFVGALSGCILYGIFCAKSVDYNFGAYILSALSSIGGIVAAGIIVTIFFYILIIGIVIAIICGLAGGL